MYGIILACVVLWSAATVSADQIIAEQWTFADGLQVKEFVAGDLKLERIVDARKNKKRPVYQVKVYRDGEELANYRNLTFEMIQSFNDGNFIFAGTNSGLSKFAYFILDKDGGLIKAEGRSEKISYCQKIGSVAHIWLSKSLDIKEIYKEVRYEGLSGSVELFSEAQVRSCNGQYVEILKR